MYPLILGGILLIVNLLTSAHVLGAQRASLVFDAGSPSGAASEETKALVNLLRTAFGFDNVSFGTEGLDSLPGTLSEFRSRLAGSEFALVYVAGHVEHDNAGTYLRLGPEATASEIKLDDLIDDVVRLSNSAIVLVEDQRLGQTAPNRTPGVGRMPTLDKVLIATTRRLQQPRSATNAFIQSTTRQLTGSDLRPRELLREVRHAVFLASAGQEVIRITGEIADDFVLSRGPYRDGAIRNIRTRARELCQYGEENEIDDKVLDYATNRKNLRRTSYLEQLDSFSLAALSEELQKEKSCFLPSLPPPRQEDPVAAIPAPGTGEANESASPKALESPTSGDQEGSTAPKVGIADVPDSPQDPSTSPVVPPPSPPKIQKKPVKPEPQKKKVETPLEPKAEPKQRAKGPSPATKGPKSPAAKKPINIPTF